jgi:hypothetical protein
MSNNEIARLTNGMKQSTQPAAPKQITIPGTYSEIFQATATVFHDLSISMPLKDYAAKEILAIAYIAKAFSSSGGSERYLVNFIPHDGNVTIEIRTIPIKYTYTPEFILERIQKEVLLQREL